MAQSSIRLLRGCIGVDWQWFSHQVPMAQLSGILQWSDLFLLQVFGIGSGTGSDRASGREGNQNDLSTDLPKPFGDFRESSAFRRDFSLSRRRLSPPRRDLSAAPANSRRSAETFRRFPRLFGVPP